MKKHGIKTRPKGFICKASAAKVLGVTLRTIDNWMRLGKIPFYRFGCRIIAFKELELLQSVEACRVPAKWETEQTK